MEYVACTFKQAAALLSHHLLHPTLCLYFRSYLASLCFLYQLLVSVHITDVAFISLLQSLNHLLIIQSGKAHFYDEELFTCSCQEKLPKNVFLMKIMVFLSIFLCILNPQQELV